MASKSVGQSFLRNITHRGYAQAATAAKPINAPVQTTETQVTKLAYGTMVATTDDHAPVSRISLLFKAGSRYENVDNLGISSILRAAVGLSTTSFSQFIISRKLSQLGGRLSCEVGREHVSYNVEINREHADFGMDLVKAVALEAEYRPWDYKTLMDPINFELHLRDEASLVSDLIHSAAFRSGLGNSLYIQPHMVNQMSMSNVEDYLNSTHCTNNMAIVATGCDHDVMLDFGNSREHKPGPVSPPTTFSGGEVRRDTGGPLAHYIVAGPGASIGGSDAAALAIAQFAIGTGPCVKYNSNFGSKFAGVTGGCASVSALNVNYSDAGLFGYYVVAEYDNVTKVAKDIHDVMKNLVLTDADVENGKKRLKAALHFASESSEQKHEDIALQCLFSYKYSSPSSCTPAIDNVPTSAVNAAVKKVFNGKLSMACTGTTGNIPYLDQL